MQRHSMNDAIEAKIVLNIKPHVLPRISEDMEFIFNFAIWAKVTISRSGQRVRRDVMNDACLKPKLPKHK
jgi:hypothetical protein